jgi:hypothetical protein
MNKRSFFVMFGLLAVLGAGCSSSQVMSALSQSTSSGSPSVTDTPLPNWQIVDAGTFTLSLPPGWKFNKLQGIDSYIGEFIGDGVKLEFDYGWYSNSLAEDNDPDHVVTYEIVDGYRAKIVMPKVAGNGTVGVYFSDLDGEQKNKTSIIWTEF